MDTSSLVALFISIIGILIGVLGALSTLRNDKLARVQVISQYYDEANSAEIKEARDRVRKNSKSYTEPYKFIDEGYNPNPDVSKLLGFYGKWATLCLNGYLPIFVFDSSSGFQLITFYEYTKEYIEFRRRQEIGEVKNVGYVISIEKLAKKVRAKYFATK